MHGRHCDVQLVCRIRAGPLDAIATSSALDVGDPVVPVDPELGRANCRNLEARATWRSVEACVKRVLDEAFAVVKLPQ